MDIGPDLPLGRLVGCLTFGDDGVIRAASGAAARWLGYAETELAGRTLAELCPTGARALLETLARHGRVEGVALPLRTRGGGELQVVLHAERGEVNHCVFLPAQARPLVEPAPPPRPNVAARRARVLIVDDEPAVGRTLARMLRTHEVSSVVRAADALARVAAGETFDLILCDLMMPEMGGVELYEAIAKVAPRLVDRMVFMTGGVYTERVDAFLRRVSCRRISKPFRPEEVRAICDGALAQEAK